MAEAGAEGGQKRPWAGWLTSIFSRRRLEADDQPVPVAEAEGGQPPGDAAVEAAAAGEAVAEGDRRRRLQAPPADGEANQPPGDQGLRSPPVLQRKSAAAFATPKRSNSTRKHHAAEGNKISPASDDAEGAVEQQPEKKRARLGDEKCCWFCLGEEGDEDGGGGTLRRDCSCRGGSGWAHLSCLVEHAKTKTAVVKYSGDVRKSSQPWESCPCCLQSYQGKMALDMAHAFSSFARETYPDPADAWKRLGALFLSCSIYIDSGMWKMASMNAELCLLAINHEREEGQNASRSRNLREYEALAFANFGHASFARGSGTDESKRKAVSHFERARALYDDTGFFSEARDAKRQIAIVKAEMEEQYVVLKRELLEVAKAHYEHDVVKFGRESAAAIRSGIVYVERLHQCGSRGLSLTMWYTNSSLEAQRLTAKLAGACKQLHGPGHRLTQKAEGVLREYKRRYAHIEGELHEVLRHEDDGKACVVIKTVDGPRDEKEGPIRTPTNQIRPMVGTPVVCQGLREATRYNGKIGCVAEPFDELTGCCKLRFEDGTLKPCPVSHELLRILFDLPSK